MATPKQQKLALLMAENARADKPQSLGNLMRKVGYSEALATHPGRIVKSYNFIETLERCGVSDKRIGNVISDAMKALEGKKKNHLVRLRAVELAGKFKGHLRPDGHDGGLESIADLVSGLKEFDLDMLLVIKSKVKPAVEPIDVVQINA